MARQILLDLDFGALKFQGDALEKLAINRNDPNGDLCDHSGDAAYFGALKAAAVLRHALLVLEHKEKEATEDANIRATARANGDKITEAAVAAALDRNPTLRAHSERVIHAQFDVDTLSAICFAFIDRRTALQELAASIRDSGINPPPPQTKRRTA